MIDLLVGTGVANLLVAFVVLGRARSAARAAREPATTTRPTDRSVPAGRAALHAKPAPRAASRPASRPLMTPEEAETARLERELLDSFSKYRRSADPAAPGTDRRSGSRDPGRVPADGGMARASQFPSRPVSRGGLL
jgi:hypothetical protein